jgi:hypothetical protein
MATETKAMRCLFWWFLELNHCCYTEMERVAGSGRQKCHFMNNQLIGLARVFNKNNGNLSFYKTFFSSLLSKMYYFCFIHIVSFGFEPTSYETSTKLFLSTLNWYFWTGTTQFLSGKDFKTSHSTTFFSVQMYFLHCQDLHNIDAVVLCVQRQWGICSVQG